MTDKQPQPQGDAAMPVVAHKVIGPRGDLVGIFENGTIAAMMVSKNTAEVGPTHSRPLVDEADAQAAIAARDARIAELEALSVTRILLEVVPGEDGMGEEVYAASVNDVERKLSELGLRADDAEGELVSVKAIVAARDAEIERLRGKLDEVHAWIVCSAIATPEDMMQNAGRIEEITRPGCAYPKCDCDGPAPDGGCGLTACATGVRTINDWAAEKITSGPAMHAPSGAVFDTVLAAADPDSLIALTPAGVHAEPARVYLVATGETHNGLETYTRHEGAPPPLCDAECLYTRL